MSTVQHFELLPNKRAALRAMQNKILKIILIASLLSTSAVHRSTAQAVIEMIYPGLGITTFNEFYLVHLELGGDKYVGVDKTSLVVTLYNLDHTVWKTIPLGNATDISTSPGGKDVLYISEHLFDLDDGVELMFVSQGSGQFNTDLVNEDGSILQSYWACFPGVFLNAPQEQQPIYNTSSGTKMLLSQTTGEATVWSLPGRLLDCCDSGFSFGQSSSQCALVVPNPATTAVMVKLARGHDMVSPVFQVHDALGAMVMERPLDSYSTSLPLPQLASATYTYRIMDQGRVLCTGRFVKE